MKDHLIYSKRCWINNSFQEATLHLKGTKIHDIYFGKKNLDNTLFSDCQNDIVMPGIIDAHVHINEPGRTHWEGFVTATKAAAKGGVTTLIEMPLNSNPVTTNTKAFDLKKKATLNKLHVNCGFYGGVIPNNETDIEDLIKAGVFGIKGFLTHSGIDDFPNITKSDLEQIAPILAKYDLPLLLHCELSDADVPKVTNPKSYKEYLASRPEHWELNAIEIALDIQKKHDIKVHIVHLATAKGFKLINEQKKTTNKLTVETCPHYLYFDAEEIPDASPIYKCAPPIREKSNRIKLWNGLLNGEFNFLGSDHSPAPPELKKLEDGNYFEAWGGIAGLQFTLPILWTSGIDYDLSLEQLIPLLTENPAKFLGLNGKKGQLKIGFDADICIWNETKIVKVLEDIIEHKHKATPYLNHSLNGKILHTFVNGKQVVKNGKFSELNAGELLLKFK
jgi:allantoinase